MIDKHSQTLNRLKKFFLRLMTMTCIIPLSLLSTVPGFSENGWSSAAEIKNTYGLTFPSANATLTTIVALDQTQYSYPAGSRVLPIKVVEWSGKAWKAPVVIATNGIKTSMPYFETRPQISGDGKTIVYLGAEDTPQSQSFRLFESTKGSTGTWSKPKIIDGIPDGWFGSRLSLNASGTILTYTQGTGGFFGGSQALMICQKKNGQWEKPIQVPFVLESGSMFNPIPSPNGKWIACFASGSSTDPYIVQPQLLTDTETSTYLPAIALGTTPEMELDLTMSPNGIAIAWYREYVKDSVVQGRDLYTSLFDEKSGTWSKPLKMNAKRLTSSLTLDSPPALSQSGTTLIYSQPNQINNSVSTADLWSMTKINGKWQPAVRITKTSQYYLFPQISSDGKRLISTNGYGLYYQVKTK